MSDALDLLKLPHLKVLQSVEKGGQYHILVESLEPTGYCEKCCCPRFYKHGSREQTFIDFPIQGKPVTIHVDRLRYRCQGYGCNQVMAHPLSDMSDAHRMTQRFVEHIEQRALETTFIGVARETGLGEATIRRIVADYIRRLEAKHSFETPRWMGLDEIHLGGKPRGVVTNVEQNCMVNMLVNRNKATVGGYISRSLDMPRIEIVTMDMWNPYRDVAKALLPKAMVVVDKFHVVRMANAALEAVRRGVRKGLAKPRRIQLKNDRYLLLKRFNTLNEAQRETVEAWSKAFPEIGAAWVAKESYFDIWDCRNAKEARECYAIWLAHLSPSAAEAFRPLTTAMANWSEEVFRYFETRATNAYTESLNSVIRMVDRAGRGYSFEVLRAKMLFAHGQVKQEQRRVSRDRPLFDTMGGAGFQGVYPDFENVEYGVSLSVLAQLIEQGEI